MMNDDSSSRTNDEVVLVTAADDGYAVPLAVTIRSALDSLSPDKRMRLFVLDGGLSTETKSRLLWSWLDSRLSVQWLCPDIGQVRDLPVSDHVNTVAYVRLLMASLLPADVTRVIYLDSDMLVRRDLFELWSEPQGTDVVLAVQDYAAPFIDSPAAMPNFERCQKFLAANWPIANFRELGLGSDAKYFNSGLLVIDLVQWRREEYASRVLECLRKHRQHVLWWDQYALNVVLAGKWRAIDQRWNQGAHIYVYPNWRDSPFDLETYNRLRNSPWIVHFCSPTKPWHYFCRHPFRRDFYRCLEETDWSGWRPPRPSDFMKRWWDFHYRPMQNHWKTQVRAVKQAIRGKRRRAA
jgi:lipopolysaccharide biosynthesis glycosyltransferase